MDNFEPDYGARVMQDASAHQILTFLNTVVTPEYAKNITHILFVAMPE